MPEAVACHRADRVPPGGGDAAEHQQVGAPCAAVPGWPKPGICGRAEGPLHRFARGAAGDGGGGPCWLPERVDRHRRASSSPRSWLARASPPPRPAAAIGLRWSTHAGGAGNSSPPPPVPSRNDHGRRAEIAESPVLSDARGCVREGYWCQWRGYRVSVAYEDRTAAGNQEKSMSTESERVAGFGQLEDGLRQASDWYLWGPYVSERQWGTVREDYSPDGEAWGYLPHDHARSRAYRWGEDGLAGFCDVEQRLCLGLALWNGRDPILKERAFGLTGAEGNHGEDVKEYWWYLDALPSHAWNRWRYHYPQAAFPYQDLIAENGRRSRFDPEYELLDTGAFDQDRYWITEVCYAKADPGDLLMAITVTNAGPSAETLHVLPTAWFRNTWSWDQDAPKPVIEAAGETSARIEHPFLGTLELLAGNAPDGTGPEL